MTWWRSPRGCDHHLTQQLNPGNQRPLTPFPVLGIYIPFAFPMLEATPSQSCDSHLVLMPSEQYTVHIYIV